MYVLHCTLIIICGLFKMKEHLMEHLMKRPATDTEPSNNASINSSCYHPPPGPTPGDLYFFFHGTTNSPPPGRQKLQIPHSRATEKQQKILT